MHYLAFGLALLLLAYHQITTWYPLFPWNDVEKYTRKELLLETSINGVLMGMGALSLLFAPKGFWLYYPLVFFPFLLIAEAWHWWVPYFFPNEKDRKHYEVHFSRTMKFIPEVAGRQTPDANHTVLQLMTFVTTAAVFFERLGVA